MFTSSYNYEVNGSVQPSSSSSSSARPAGPASSDSVPGQPRSDRAVAPSSADHVFQVRGQGGEVELTCDERGFVFKDTKKIGEGLYALLFLFF